MFDVWSCSAGGCTEFDVDVNGLTVFCQCNRSGGGRTKLDVDRTGFVTLKDDVIGAEDCDRVFDKCNRRGGGCTKFDTGNAAPAVGNDDIAEGRVICTNGSEAACRIAIYAGVSGGTICKRLGSTTFNGVENVPTTGANIG